MHHPEILFEGKYNEQELGRLRAKPLWREKDIYKEQLQELYEIHHSSERLSEDYLQQRDTFVKENTSPNPDWRGNWAYFPWSGLLIHTVGQDEYNQLRTNRNQLLITADEQRKLLHNCVAFAGLSIGSQIATTLAYNGIASTMKLAESDSLETSNLNRVRASLAEVGEKKIDIASRQLYEANPYQKILTFEDGVTSSNIGQFLGGDNPPKLIFEAIDDFVMKVRLRIEARKRHIPVIMLTNLGDSLLIDVERYDQDPHLPLFNGRIGSTPEEIISKPLTEMDKVRYAIKIVSFDYTPTKALATLLEINKTLVGRPQLASTVTISGGVGAYIARQILLNYPLPSGRSLVRFNDWFNIPDADDINIRGEIIRTLQERFNV